MLAFKNEPDIDRTRRQKRRKLLEVLTVIAGAVSKPFQGCPISFLSRDQAADVNANVFVRLRLVSRCFRLAVTQEQDGVVHLKKLWAAFERGWRYLASGLLHKHGNIVRPMYWL